MFVTIPDRWWGGRRRGSAAPGSDWSGRSRGTGPRICQWNPGVITMNHNIKKPATTHGQGDVIIE